MSRLWIFSFLSIWMSFIVIIISICILQSLSIMVNSTISFLPNIHLFHSLRNSYGWFLQCFNFAWEFTWIIASTLNFSCCSVWIRPFRYVLKSRRVSRTSFRSSLTPMEASTKHVSTRTRVPERPIPAEQWTNSWNELKYVFLGVILTYWWSTIFWKASRIPDSIQKF